MFVVYVGSALTTVLWAQAPAATATLPLGSFSLSPCGCGSPCCSPTSPSAAAEGRSKAQAASLRGTKKTVMAKKLRELRYGAATELRPGTELRRGDGAGGSRRHDPGRWRSDRRRVASVNESAITGESA